MAAVAVLAAGLGHSALAQVSQENRFAILRTLIADTAASRMVMPLGPDGVRLSEDGSVDEEHLREELRSEGRSIEIGEVVTITESELISGMLVSE